MPIRLRLFLALSATGLVGSLLAAPAAAAGESPPRRHAPRRLRIRQPQAALDRLRRGLQCATARVPLDYDHSRHVSRYLLTTGAAARNGLPARRRAVRPAGAASANHMGGLWEPTLVTPSAPRHILRG
jgi:hypothetical protein